MISVPADFSCYDSHATADVTLDAIVQTVSTVSEDVSFPVPNLATLDLVQNLPSATKISQNQSEVTEPMEWTPKLEAKFNRLAQRKAFNELSLVGNVEFEKLSAYRRQLKNPRTGEEVIAEYEQRMITRDLVQALAKYVNWHKQYASNNSR